MINFTAVVISSIAVLDTSHEFCLCVMKWN